MGLSFERGIPVPGLAYGRGTAASLDMSAVSLASPRPGRSPVHGWRYHSKPQELWGGGVGERNDGGARYEDGGSGILRNWDEEWGRHGLLDNKVPCLNPKF